MRHQQFEFLVRLSINLSAFHNARFEFAESRKALELGLTLVADDDKANRAKLLHNLGTVYQVEGDFSTAQAHFEEAEGLFTQIDAPGDALSVRSAKGQLLYHQGNYRKALLVLETLDGKLSAHLQVTNLLTLIVCYQLLGAHAKAAVIASQLIERQAGVDLLNRAMAYMYWGESLAEIDGLAAAVEAFDCAESLFREADALSNVHEVCVRRAHARLKFGDLQGATTDAQRALESQDVYVIARANLALGEAALGERRLADAKARAAKAFTVARRNVNESAHFDVLMLLGKVREAQHDYGKASQHYQRANRLVLHLQRDLTIDFRPGFLEGAQGAMHGLIRVALHQDDAPQALKTLEQMKSLVVAQYLGEKQALRLDPEIADADGEISKLTAAYQKARDHYWRLVNEETQPSASDTHHQEKHEVEQRLSDLVAKIRLLNSEHRPELDIPELDSIDLNVPLATGVVEYYSDGEAVYAFTLASQRAITVKRLDATYRDVANSMKSLRRSIERALALDANGAAEYYLDKTQAALRALNDTLFMPIQDFLSNYPLINIVPFGALHSVPFHLLYDGSHYAIEKQQIVIQPALAIMGRPRTQSYTRSAVALGYSGGADVYRMEHEAQAIAALMGGTAHIDDEATSQRLANARAQILHIAAHGHHHFDQPRLAHLHLADGLMYVDDLWRFNLNYELVTLSACSVGLGNPSGGDELIGLGHAFLYAGADALVSSLWEVDDETAEKFNGDFYSRLKQG
ncbi:MAG: CHAT domain-containing protein, partial [Chloroflexi bacterium]|nr:CHAT domain-containing protein [Chloroflexota bacterium]